MEDGSHYSFQNLPQHQNQTQHTRKIKTDSHEETKLKRRHSVIRSIKKGCVSLEKKFVQNEVDHQQTSNYKHKWQNKAHQILNSDSEVLLSPDVGHYIDVRHGASEKTHKIQTTKHTVSDIIQKISDTGHLTPNITPEIPDTRHNISEIIQQNHNSYYQTSEIRKQPVESILDILVGHSQTLSTKHQISQA